MSVKNNFVTIGQVTKAFMDAYRSGASNTREYPKNEVNEEEHYPKGITEGDSQSTIYTIATKRSYPGQGGGHEELTICRLGLISGEFPEFFTTREKAEEYNRSKRPHHGQGVVVACIFNVDQKP